MDTEKLETAVARTLCFARSFGDAPPLGDQTEAKEVVSLMIASLLAIAAEVSAAAGLDPVACTTKAHGMYARVMETADVMYAKYAQQRARLDKARWN